MSPWNSRLGGIECADSTRCLFPDRALESDPAMRPRVVRFRLRSLMRRFPAAVVSGLPDSCRAARSPRRILRQLQDDLHQMSRPAMLFQIPARLLFPKAEGAARTED